MSRKCPLSGKHPVTGNNRSHSLRATRRKWNVNLQKATIVDENGKKVKVLISTSALRTLRKNHKNVKTSNIQTKAVETSVEAPAPSAN